MYVEECMKLSLKILENNKTIEQLALNALLPQIENYMTNGINTLKRELPEIVRAAIVNTPEYESIMNGKLKYEFGIPDPSSKLAGLLDIWSNNIQVQYMKPNITGSKIKGFFSANMVRIDFADVLYTDYALVIDNLRGYNLPWLEWLLLDGNQTIVSKHTVSIRPSIYSRTGNAVMIESNKSWRVPAEFSGTISDNWITRALINIESTVEDLLQRAFK